ncbi:helix-turn-helix domain-containing protein [Longimycelium tulufanense]
MCGTNSAPNPLNRADASSLAQRGEVSRGLAADLSFRAIATGLGRPSPTVSRELTGSDGRAGYRAAWSRAWCPKPTKLSRLPGLAAMVEEKLERDGRHSGSRDGCDAEKENTHSSPTLNL